MHASGGKKCPPYIGILAHLEIQYLPPLYTGTGCIGVLACGGTGLTTDAAIQIHHHCVACHDLYLSPGDIDPHQIGAGAGGVGQIEQHGDQRIHARHLEFPGQRRGPVIELANQQ